jgi:hypothetical protein
MQAKRRVVFKFLKSMKYGRTSTVTKSATLIFQHDDLVLSIHRFMGTISLRLTLHFYFFGKQTKWNNSLTHAMIPNLGLQ